jgi:hypothetical protein
MKFMPGTILQLKRLVCFFFGHRLLNGSMGNVGITLCARCRKLENRTSMRAVTRGQIERRMAAHPPEGYSFVNCNWKKRKAKFVAPTGKLLFITL